jgi:putative hydrolase of the HAD superfamily
MDLSGITTLGFDCYGTLIDWEAGILAELRPWARQHGFAAGDEALLEAFASVEATVQRETPSALYRDVLAETHRRLAERLGAPLDDAAARDFGRSVGRWPAFPDSPAALARLAQRYRLVILSNVDRESFAQSNERLGVRFAHVFTAQDIGSYKPALANFEYLLANLAAVGVDRHAILHVAQSLFHDIEPARRLGLATCWVNRRRGRSGWGATPAPAGAVKPDLEVADLAELAALLVPGG